MQTVLSKLMLGDQPQDKMRYWVALNMVLGVGKTLFHRLVKALGSPERVFASTRKELMQVEGIGEKIARQVLGFDVEKNVEREFRLLKNLSARVITSECPEYPRLLKSIYDPPPIIYCQGKDLREFPITIAVVGTRVPTNYGKLVTEKICGGLSEMGVCIVSGMARGIDSMAHRAAIKEKGPTVAVFGCGLSHTYPPENRTLRERIIENGAVISEFPVSIRPDKNNFPARNRIISGLSIGTLVVEAGEKSGALITADFALEQGREVFAAPGGIFSPKSRGSNFLIKSGAKLVDKPEAIVEEFPEAVKSLLKLPETKELSELDLTPNEGTILALLSLEEKHIDQIIETSRLSPAEVSATLVQLELKGMVRQLNNNLFISDRRPN